MTPPVRPLRGLIETGTLHMRFIHPVLVLWLSVATVSISAEPITAAGQAAQLDIRAAGEHSIRARQTGLPLMRAMWLHYPHDAAARALGTQYLWGRDLLIAPVFEKGATSRAVYLPAGTWYDWWTRATHAGGQTVNRAVDLATMPIFVRAGAILPLDPVRQYTSQVVRESTTLRVYRGADGQYTLYEDDGISQDYLSGKGTWTRMTWNERSARLTLEPGPPRGATNLTGPRTFTVELIPDGTTRTVPYSGRRVDVRF